MYTVQYRNKGGTQEYMKFPTLESILEYAPFKVYTIKAMKLSRLPWCRLMIFGDEGIMKVLTRTVKKERREHGGH